MSSSNGCCLRSEFLRLVEHTRSTYDLHPSLILIPSSGTHHQVKHESTKPSHVRFPKDPFVPTTSTYQNRNVKTLSQSSCRALAASGLNKGDHTSNYMTTAQWDNFEATICRGQATDRRCEMLQLLVLDTRGQGYFCTLLCRKLGLPSNFFNFEPEASSPLWSRGLIYRATSFARKHSKCTRSRPSNKPFLRQSSFHDVSDENHRDLTRFARLKENRLSVLYQQYSLLKLQKLELSRPKWNGWASSDIKTRMFFESLQPALNKRILQFINASAWFEHEAKL